MKSLSLSEIKKFQKTIWDHYKKHGRKMPWRTNNDPYWIVVSEIMLQQTQVERVVPKFLAFVEKFPNWKALAASSIQDLLKMWQGLGYNRRALSLKRIAEWVIGEHTGSLPQEIEKLDALPGIGYATASSIAAFAFNKPSIFIETNIRRVFIHYFFPKKKSVNDTEIMKLVEQTLPKKSATGETSFREWYYALMDYGAFLKREVVNPNRKSAHYAKQSKFEGSDRQIRGKILKMVTLSACSFAKLQKETGADKEKCEKIIMALVAEGFLHKKGRRITLAS
jgi:A/G-specific adenine glycosylase